MTRRFIRLIFFLLQVAVWPAVAAVDPYIGYVYPAGARAESTVSVTLGGQYIKDFSGLVLNGRRIEAEMTGYLRVYERQEVQRLRRQKETVEARLAEEKSTVRMDQMRRVLAQVEQELEMVMRMQREDRRDPDAAARKQFNPQISERIDVRFRLPPGLPPGEAELRVVTASGLSNPLRFWIGTIPEILEQEPNDGWDEAQRLPELPLIVNGQILPGEIDCFRFTARRGQTLVVRADARLLIPYLADAVPGWFQAVLALYDASGQEVAYNDTFRCDPDPLLVFEVPEDGDYTLVIRDAIFRGREDFVYRLSLGSFPLITSVFPPGGPAGSQVEVELSGVNLPVERMTVKTMGSAEAPGVQFLQVENNGLLSNRFPFHVDRLPETRESEEGLGVLPPEAIVNGRISRRGEVDVYRFAGRKGEIKRIEVIARRLGSPLDSRLTLLDSQGRVLAVNDDEFNPADGLNTHHADSRIEIRLPESGLYEIRVEDVLGAGGGATVYRLVLSGAQPDFELRVTPSSLRIPRGGSALATVHVIRVGGFDGPVSLSLVDAPAGLELQRATVPSGRDRTQIILLARDRVGEQILPLHIAGSARIDGRMVRRRAIPADDRMQAFLYRHLVPAQQLLARISAPEPVVIDLTLPPDGILRARPGTQVQIPARCRWGRSERRPIRVSLSDPPEWATLPSAQLSHDGGTLVLAISPNAEVGSTAVLLLNGVVNIPLRRDDPQFNPVVAALNNRLHEFVIDAIPVMITD